MYETNKIVKNENGSKTIQEIQEKKYEINSVPFKSLIQNEENSNIQELPPFSSKYLIKQNNLFNNTPYNPFALSLNTNQNSNSHWAIVMLMIELLLRKIIKTKLHISFLIKEKN